MASLITHPIVPIAIAAAIGRNVVGTRLVLLGCFVAILPDFDVIAFQFGIPYESPYGHRGFTHSIGFSLAVAAMVAMNAKLFQRGATVTFAFIFIASLSHPLLDALTDGGLGVALAWPLSDLRVFAPWRPITVSPIGIDRFFSEWGLRVMFSEIVWVWLPAALIVISARCARGKPVSSRDR